MGDVGEVEAEAVVLKGIVIMMSVHKVVGVVLGEEGAVTLIIAITTAGAGGPEVGALDEEEGGVAEALEGRETEVQLGKGVLREGQRSSNGTEKKNNQKAVLKLLPVTTIITIASMMIMETITMNPFKRSSSISISKMMEVTITDQSGFVWFVPILCSWLIVFLKIRENYQRVVGLMAFGSPVNPNLFGGQEGEKCV